MGATTQESRSPRGPSCGASNAGGVFLALVRSPLWLVLGVDGRGDYVVAEAGRADGREQVRGEEHTVRRSAAMKTIVS